MCLLTTRRSTAGQQRASCGDSRPRNRPWSHKDKKTHTPCTKPHSSLSSNHVNTQLYLSTPFIRCLCCLEKSTLPPQAACDTWPDKQTTTACSWIPIKTWRTHIHHVNVQGFFSLRTHIDVHPNLVFLTDVSDLVQWVEGPLDCGPWCAANKERYRTLKRNTLGEYIYVCWSVYVMVILWQYLNKWF